MKTRQNQKQFPVPKKFDYNLVVIEGGSAGLVSAYIASAAKAKVALIEKEKMGGDCLNSGCVPSKACSVRPRCCLTAVVFQNLEFKTRNPMLILPLSWNGSSESFRG
jgi:ribulose 1,5-bisphosphate synthetase/thiazole synthase